jgi:EAL domain-containing protein (putative c-di-GMP-specific phosphodiesterase class I)
MIDATQEDGELMADRIRARLAAPIEVAGATLQLRVSVGVALAEAGGIDAEEALRNADFAMQWAKGLGKARAEVYNANLHAKALDRLELRSDLQRGLRGEELVLHYQPTMCLQEGTVAGFEALVRWQHPTRGLLMPAEFIPLAEETGLIVPLGSWVLREACRFAVTLPHRGQDLSMSVNVATQQLYQDGFVDEVREVLRETGLRPNRLVLEITETALLSELDLDVLKVDKSFIDRLAEDAQGRSITQAILTMSRELHLETVAEGVEDPGQADWLIQEHCTMAQGYLWSKPVDAEGVRRLLEARPAPRHAGSDQTGPGLPDLPFDPNPQVTPA